MTLSNIRRDFEWYTFLASGQFTERNFDFEIKTDRPGEEPGRTVQGAMPKWRKDLIMSDASNHLQDLINKVTAQRNYLILKGNMAAADEYVKLFPEIFKDVKVKN